MNLNNVVAIVPAAGKGSRISPISCSKEIFPIGFHDGNSSIAQRPKVVSHYLFEKFRIASIKRVYIVIRDGKWDIPAYFGDGSICDMQFAYIPTEETKGHPYTIQKALPFIKDQTVAFGFPDIIFNKEDVFRILLDKLNASDSDVVLGLFLPESSEKWDMVDIDESNSLREIHYKPKGKGLVYTWFVAVWTPKFTNFLDDFLNNSQPEKVKSQIEERGELILDHIIMEALKLGMKIQCVPFNDINCIDIGTPYDLMQAVYGKSNRFKNYSK